MTFTREIIHVDSVETQVFEGDGGAPVLYARIKNFQKDTTEELRKAVREAETAHPKVAGIILDLRNNPGGLLEQAIALSDGFLDEGTIVSTRGPEAGATTREEAKRDPQISAKPLIVLVNQGSASASEIVSGALKPSRALLVGQKTFGKGSVQKLYQLTDGGALKLTVAQYLTPGDVSIQSIGIQPDISVYPARVDGSKMRLGSPPDHVEEADLENAFKDWGNAKEKPWADVQYFEPPSDEEKEKSPSELTRAERMVRLKKDFPLRLARRILGSAKPTESSRGRKELLSAAEGVLKEVRREESDKISRDLSRLGVDWSTGEGVVLPSLIKVAGPKDLQAKAGSKVQVSFSVRNTGTTPAYGVWGRTDSSNPVFKNLDFVFGKLGPGEEKAWAAEVEVPKSTVDRWDEVTLDLKQMDGSGAGSGTGFVRTAALPKPDFAYTCSAASENAAGPSRLKDGKIEEGSRVRLNLRVRNRGDGPSQNTEVNIRGDEKEELYLETARQKLTNLGPKSEESAPMVFRLVKAGEDGKVTVNITVSDRDSATVLSDTLQFQVGAPCDPSQARIPPAFRLSAAPPLRTDADRIVLDLDIADDEAVGDFFAYVGDKKVRYERNRAGGSVFPVHLEVPLKEGSNRLLLSARDQKKIQSNRVFMIYRTASKGEGSLGMK